MAPNYHMKDAAALLRRRQAIWDALAVVDRKITRTKKQIARLRRRLAAAGPGCNSAS
jgi:hypothetical protein